MAGEQGQDPMAGAAAQLDAMNRVDNTAAFQQMGESVPTDLTADAAVAAQSVLGETTGENGSLLNVPDATGLSGDQMTAAVENAAVRGPQALPQDEASRQMDIANADRANRDAAGLPPRTHDLQ